MKSWLMLMAATGTLGLVGVVALSAKPEPISVVAYEAGIEVEADRKADAIVRLASCGVMLTGPETVAAVELFADAWGPYWQKAYLRRARAASEAGFDCQVASVVTAAHGERDRSVERFYWVGLHLACKGKGKIPLDKVAAAATATFGANARDALWLLFDAADRSHQSLSEPTRTTACVNAAKTATVK